MSPEEKRARRRERDRAAYASDPEKFRELARKNRLKPGAAERHKEYAKAWAARNAERVKVLRKARYEENRNAIVEHVRAWKSAILRGARQSAFPCHHQPREESSGAQSLGAKKPYGGVREL